MLVEIAPVQQGDQPTPHVVGVAQVVNLVHGRDDADNQQWDAIVEEVRPEHSRRKEAVSELLLKTFFFLSQSQSPYRLMFESDQIPFSSQPKILF